MMFPLKPPLSDSLGISQPCLMTPEDHFPFFYHEPRLGTHFFSSCRSDTSLNWSSGSNTRQRLATTRWWRGAKIDWLSNAPKNWPQKSWWQGGNHQESYFDEHAWLDLKIPNPSDPNLSELLVAGSWQNVLQPWLRHPWIAAFKTDLFAQQSADNVCLKTKTLFKYI